MAVRRSLQGLRFRRLLVPLDFSEASTRAVHYAADIALSTGADLCLLHVAPPEVSERGVRALTEAVRQFSERAGVYAPAVQVVVGQGSPPLEIVRTAHSGGIDMVVLASRSRVHTLAAVVGETARGVLRRCRIPVVSLDAEAVFPLRHLTFVDLDNAASRRAVELLRALTLSCQPRVLLVAASGRSNLSRLEELRRHLLAYTGIELTIETRLVRTRFMIAELLEVQTDLVLTGRNDAGQGVPHLLSPTVRRLVRRSTPPVLSVPSSRIEEIDLAFRNKARSFTVAALSRSSSLTAESDQIMSDLAGAASGGQSSHLLLGTYGDIGLLDSVEQLGILQLLRSKGFDDFTVRIGQRAGRDLVQLYCDGHESPETLLVEVLQDVRSVLPEPWMQRHLGTDPLRILDIEWVLMQNPRESFSQARPPLPGQKRPGLGIGYEIAELFVLAAERLGCDGLWNSPQHYHNARLYHERFHFVDPDMEGLVLALERDSAGHGLADTSWAVEEGRVRDESRVFPWHGYPQFFPISARTRSLFETLDYQRRVRRAVARKHFVIDWREADPVRM